MKELLLYEETEIKLMNTNIMLSGKSQNRIHALWFNSRKFQRHAKLNNMLFETINKYSKMIKKSKERLNQNSGY